MDIHNAHIALIPVILKKHGVEKIVISPGSRNAPLIQVFFKVFGDNCISIVDERSAAYFALGIAIKSQKPVVLLSTSGTATLNYSPAVAEAFHQGVPLIAITADRPPEWIDMQDNQTIRQQNIYAQNCKAGYELPVVVTSKDDEQYITRIINQAYNTCIEGKPGPVHINVPLREPLYNDIPIIDNVRFIKANHKQRLNIDTEIIQKWDSYKKVLIVIGQMPPLKGFSEVVNKLLEDDRVIVFAEPLSNIKGEKVISQLDIIRGIKESEIKAFQPELVVFMGGQIVSKPLKQFLRNSNSEQWFVSPSGEFVDTFQNLTIVIKASPIDFFKGVLEMNKFIGLSDYQSNWLARNKSRHLLIEASTSNVEYSDLSVFKTLSKLIDEDVILFAGNSSVIRYLQTFSLKQEEIYGNRGTSGIDGCLSTASGVASATNKPVYAILGDISFMYDSNALWNRGLPDNLKIIVINNQGGNIFGMIDGPSLQVGYKEFLVANHSVNLKKISEAFGVEYYLASSEVEIKKDFKQFSCFRGCAIMEIITPGEINPGIFRNFVENISK